MPYVRFRRLAAILLPAAVLAACSTVDLSQPEMPLPARFNDGAEIRLTSFSASAGFGVSAEGPALSILRDQLTYGMVRCSRPGPVLELEIAADFTTRKDLDGEPEHLIGLATWRDPATRQVVGRHHLDVAAQGGSDGYVDVHVRPNDGEDGLGASVPRNQLMTGEAFVAQVCERAFGREG